VPLIFFLAGYLVGDVGFDLFMKGFLEKARVKRLLLY
jgi:hypothetical protein